jgi:DNA polymerase-1
VRNIDSLPFSSVVAVDFEFTAPPGECPRPICMVAHELKSGQRFRLFGDELARCESPPYPIGENSLIVTYYGSAEVGCHLALGWQPPARHLDLYAEYRCVTNGADLACGNRGLLGALATFGLPAIDAAEKQQMRDLAMRGAPYTRGEASALLDYCESDVLGTGKLLEAMLPQIDLSRALVRGRYMTAAAHIERVGVPIDVEMQHRLSFGWDGIKHGLVQSIDHDYGAFDGISFRTDRWESYLIDHNIPWPRLASGRLALDDDTFREMARAHPAVAPMRELRHALSDLRLNALEVGADGRNRVLLSAFGARSSRNTPSNTKFIFGPSVWLRGLIRAQPGQAIAYVDWSQQEFGIAAALSGDPAMIDAYVSGDPYLTFGKQAGRIPPGGTKHTHPTERELFKSCALGVQYGMEADSLAARIGVPRVAAVDLLRLHRSTYRRFWEWVDGAVDYAMLHGTLHTTLGWKIHRGSNPNPRSLRNFLMQANGAEMLRLACCYATEGGIAVCAPVHDALLIEASIERIDDAVAATKAAMAKASSVVLSGFELRSDVRVFPYPQRYADERGARMWSEVQRLLQ